MSKSAIRTKIGLFIKCVRVELQQQKKKQKSLDSFARNFLMMAFVLKNWKAPFFLPSVVLFALSVQRAIHLFINSSFTLYYIYSKVPTSKYKRICILHQRERIQLCISFPIYIWKRKRETVKDRLQFYSISSQCLKIFERCLIFEEKKMLRLDGVYVTTSRFWEIISDFLSVEWLEMRPF